MMPDQHAVRADIDSRRIQRLRSRIAEEAYEVNPRQIADKMIDLEDALFRQRPMTS